MTTRIYQLYRAGQAIWYDDLRRSLIESGEIEALVEDGLAGLTSNPTIFEKAIAGGAEYDQAVLPLAAADCTVQEIYESIVLDDISQAADLFRPVYDRTEGVDGFVSLEVDPDLAHSTQGTIREARSLFQKLNRPNIMIKVPATEAGIPAVEALIGEGININVTLVFSTEVYRRVAEAYLRGLEAYAASGGNPARVASVASFFVSRVDTAVDKALAEAGDLSLQGKIAIANAEVAYAIFQDIFSGSRWDALARQGAHPQRVLWASTGTKNPAYPDTLYVDSLIGSNTVNTMPPATLNAWLDHGSLEPVLGRDLDGARKRLARLAELGIDLHQITDRLLSDGVASFAESFHTLQRSIGEKRERLLQSGAAYQAALGDYEARVLQAQAEMTSEDVLGRILRKDHTVWRESPEEIANRLGWLTIAERMQAEVGDLQDFARTAREAGFTQALLLGMGGSSLAPDVFQKTFGVAEGYLDLAVLDSTDAEAVRAQTALLDLSKTLFIVATKSGGTVETLSFFKHFYNLVADRFGASAAGSHFIAITDPGSSLVALAEKHNFRRVFVNDPDIGGRYSALSYFGLVPAALLGVDLGRLLERAVQAQEEARAASTGSSSAFRLGAALGELHRAGRDKLTLVLSTALESLGDWVEQLVAESTGKSGQGILPVVGESLGKPEVYGRDRFFVSVQLESDAAHDPSLALLESAGQPLVRLQLRDIYDLGGQFFLWELATAVAGARMGIQPFDQPNVEAAKKWASRLVEQYSTSGRLPEGQAESPSADRLRQFLEAAKPGSYIALQVYLAPNDRTTQALDSLRLALRALTGAAVTSGYGPRYLHSTGQLHKGDGGNGLFLQFTSESDEDIPIPDRAGEPGSSIGFNVLKMAQALGDFQALREAEPPRPVLRFHLKGDAAGQIERLAAELAP